MINRFLTPSGQKLRWLLFSLVAFLVGLAAYLPFDYTAHSSSEFYFFEADLISDHAGATQVYYDVGRGFNETDSSVHPLTASTQWVHHQYALPPGKLKQLRFDFNDHAGHYSIAHPRIADFRGKTIRSFAAGDFTLRNEIKALSASNEEMIAATEADSRDPFIGVVFSPALALPYGWAERINVVERHFLPVFFLVLVLGGVASAFSKFAGVTGEKIVRASTRRPLLSLAGVAALSVVIQLHPLIFSGKSLVSPNITYLLYDHFPTVPGYTDDSTENFKGSDVAALIYSHLLYPGLQRRALFVDHELPLWDRYDLGGTPMLGQGQSMFGELLHMIPLLTGGAAWSWDLKFILARWIFALALGVFVFRATASFIGSVGVAAIAPWIGYFEYRANHPAQFTLCLAPLILLAWAYLADAENRRSRLICAAGLFFANWEVLTSGTVKEAYITMLSLNFAGLLYLIFRDGDRKEKWLRITSALGAGVVFLLVSAPLWWVFLDTLAESRTAYDTPMVRQIPGWQIIGLFEDLFYRRFNALEGHGNPSTNMIVLLGAAWACAIIFERTNRTVLALMIAISAPAALAFGVVPAGVILRIPFLQNIYHVGNTFSCPIVILLLAMAGIGFASFTQDFGSPKNLPRALLAGLLIAGLLGLYYFNAQHAPRSSFFAGYTVSLLVGLGAFGLAVAKSRQLGRSLVTLSILASAAVVLWRHGAYNHIYFDEYVLNPPPREKLDAPSPSIEAVKAREAEPERITGFGQNLYCGASQLYFQEGIYGIEAVRSRYYDELMVAVDLPKAISWGKARYGGERGPSRGAMDMLNVRFYLDNVDARDATSGLKKEDTLDLQVYESPTVWPRAFFTTRIVRDATLDEFAARLRAPGVAPFADLLPDEAAQMGELNLIEGDSTGAGEVSPAKNYKLTNNTTSFVVDASGPGLIVLSESYYAKDFRVFLNDKPASYVRTNYAFKGIPVLTSGTYEVRVEYWPHHLTPALILMCLGLLFALISAIPLLANRGLQAGVQRPI